MNQRDYKKWAVWNKSMSLARVMYELTDKFPKEEGYGLVSQLRRAAVSIPSNIAEGSRRKDKEKKHFLRIAYGSGAELETQIELSKTLSKMKDFDYKEVEGLLDEVMRLLNVMIYRE